MLNDCACGRSKPRRQALCETCLTTLAGPEVPTDTKQIIDQLGRGELPKLPAVVKIDANGYLLARFDDAELARCAAMVAEIVLARTTHARESHTAPRLVK